MNILKEYLKTINKDKCPCSCEFKSEKKIEIALVPPLKEISSILISRDPTTKWLSEGYEDAKDLSNTERRKKLFDTAIPQQLVKQIGEFKGEKEKNLCKSFIYEKGYWTHLHKCFTDVKNKFSCTNSTRCAE